MANYSFKDTINFFGGKLEAEPPEDELEAKRVELLLDDNQLILSEGAQEGSLKITFELGMFVGPIDKDHLKELTSSNFLGVNTGGCTLALDSQGSTLSLLACTSPGTPPQDNWEWLHRVYSIAQQWVDAMSKWEEFTPIATFNVEASHVRPGGPQQHVFKA